MSAMDVEVAGRRVTLPVEVRDASVGSASFLLPARRLRRLVPPGLAVTRVLPGRGMLTLAMIDYRDNDLGVYRELSVAILAHVPPARPPIVGPLLRQLRGSPSVWIHRLPVDEAFSCAAGRGIWGFPKTVDELEIRREGDRARCVWHADGEHVLTLEVPAGGERPVGKRSMLAYTRIDDALHATRFRIDGDGAGGGLGGARLELGAHPYARELAGLGLPRRAVGTGWVERLTGSFDPPQQIGGG